MLDNLLILNNNCLRMFNYTEHLVKEALCWCSNTNSSFDEKSTVHSLQSVDKFVDLGIQRTSCAGYAGHWKEISAKARKIVGAIRRAFQYKTRDLMCPASQTYILPKLMYCSQAWSP